MTNDEFKQTVLSHGAAKRQFLKSAKAAKRNTQTSSPSPEGSDLTATTGSNNAPVSSPSSVREDQAAADQSRKDLDAAFKSKTGMTLQEFIGLLR